MIRVIIAALFPHPGRADWVPGVGFVSLPGALRDSRPRRDRAAGRKAS